MRRVIAICARYCLFIIATMAAVVGITADPCRAQGTALLQNDAKIDGLVRIHETTQGLLHTLDMNLDIYEHGPSTGTSPGKSLSGQWRWSKDDFCERIRNIDFAPGEEVNVKSKLYMDQFEDGRFRKVLKGWNADRPVKLNILHQHEVTGFIDAQTTRPSIAGDPAVALLLKIRDITNANNARCTLRQTIERAAVVELLPVNGDSFTRLRVWSKIQSSGDRKVGNYLDFYLDSTVGMLIRKCVNHHDAWEWPGVGVVPWAEWVHEVTAFQKAGDGAYVPTSATFKSYRAGQDAPTSVTEFLTTSHLANSPLPQDALDFKFPENLLVVTGVDTNRRTVDIWGPDNKSVRTIQTSEEMLAARQELGQMTPIDTGKPPEFRSATAAWIVLAGVLLITGIILAMRNRKKLGGTS